jgi:hypothetical protein
MARYRIRSRVHFGQDRRRERRSSGAASQTFKRANEMLLIFELRLPINHNGYRRVYGLFGLHRNQEATILSDINHVSMLVERRTLKSDLGTPASNLEPLLTFAVIILPSALTKYSSLPSRRLVVVHATGKPDVTVLETLAGALWGRSKLAKVRFDSPNAEGLVRTFLSQTK